MDVTFLLTFHLVSADAEQGTLSDASLFREPGFGQKPGGKPQESLVNLWLRFRNSVVN